MPPVALISLYDEFCIGLRYVAAYLTEKGHPATLINFKQYARQDRDTAPRDLDEGYLIEISPQGEVYLDYSTPITQTEEDILFDLLRQEPYVLVGFSVPSYHRHVARDLTEKIRERLGIPVVVGGVHPSVAPEDCAEWADFTCLGEGEESALALVEVLAEGKNPAETEIPGVWVRKSDGTVLRNHHRPPPADLNDLPHPQHDPALEYFVEGDRLYHEEPLLFSQLFWNYKSITGRGCPYYCSFCVWSTLKRDYKEMRKLRRRSPENAVEELLIALRRNPAIEMFEFEDDIFTVQKDWLRRFAPLYKEKVAKPFWCYTYPNFVNEENLGLLKDMGIAYITMGVQSGSDRINYEVYDRHTERARVVKAMQMIADFGIPANYDIITNNPYETDEDRMETLTLISQIPGAFNLHIGKLAYFPGTTITQRAAEEQKIGKDDETIYRFWNALYLMAMLRVAGEEELVGLTRDPYLRENPDVLWSMLRHHKTTFENKRELEKLQRENETLRLSHEKLRADYEGLVGRRVVKYGTKLADTVKQIVKT